MSLSFVSSSVLSSSDGVSHDTEKPIENQSSSSTINRSGNYKPLYEQLRQNQQDAQDKYDEMTKALRGTRTLDDEDVAHLTSMQNLQEERELMRKREVEMELEMFRAARAEKGMSVVTEISSPGDTHVYDNDNDNNYDDEQNNFDSHNDHNNNNNNNNNNGSDLKGMSSKSLIRPKIIVTKKRKRAPVPDTKGSIQPSARRDIKDTVNDDMNNCASSKPSDENNVNVSTTTTTATTQQTITNTCSNTLKTDKSCDENDSSSLDKGDTLTGLLTGYGSESDSE